MGTPAYMSPEQVRGQTDVDHRTDIWSLGVVMYEIPTGELPFSGQSFPAIGNSIINARPTPLRQRRPDLPRDYCRIVENALEKRRDRRSQSMADWARQMDGLRVEEADEDQEIHDQPTVLIQPKPGTGTAPVKRR